SNTNRLFKNNQPPKGADVHANIPLPMPSRIPSTMPARISPIAIPLEIAGVMAVTPPTPSHRNGHIRTRVSPIIGIGSHITPTHRAEYPPAEYNQPQAFHDVPPEFLRCLPTVFLSNHFVVTLLSAMTRWGDGN